MSTATAGTQTSSETKSGQEGQIKKLVEFRRNEKGQRVQVIRTVQVVRVQKRVNKNVERRKEWRHHKFGDCEGKGPGIEQGITSTAFNEVIDLSDLRPRAKEDVEREEKVEIKIGPSMSIVECRNCGEKGHWTRMCPKPKRADLPQADYYSEEQSSASSASGATPGAYVPPSRRAGAALPGAPGGPGRQGPQRDDSAGLRVTNLSDSVTEDDLRDLFGRFGRVVRCYLAKDRVTRESRGFAFIHFETRKEAERAMQALNGHGYDNLILRVDWAQPREAQQERS